MDNLTSEQQNSLLEPYFATPPPDSDLLEVLQRVFNLNSFRRGQLDAIRHIISGKDCFVRMATGSGKSLLWQLPALVQTNRCRSLTVVICPTKILIMDQMLKLCKLAPAIEAVCYHRDQPNELNLFALQLLRWHDILPHFLLVTPEALQSEPAGGKLIRNRLKEIYAAGCLAQFVIDEADKFLGWGKSFRESYLELGTLRHCFPNVPILAMSGSITKANIQDTIKKLGIQQYEMVSDSLNRPNLHYAVKSKDNPKDAIIADIMALVKEGPGIVYCTSVKETETLASKLQRKGVHAMVYHAKLSEEKPKDALDSWKAGTAQVIVATTAFGMGVDKSNVRWVVHDTMPTSIEGWFQESGRAGRDGLPAKCTIYFQAGDYYKVRQLITLDSKPDNLAQLLEPLHQLTEILLNTVSCRRKQLLAHFDEAFPQENCGACDNCVDKWKTPWSYQDVTVDVLNALHLLSQMRQIYPHWTETDLAAAIHGERTKGTKLDKFGVTALQGFGCQFAQACGKNATRSEIIAFILILIGRKVITEYKPRFNSNDRNKYAQSHVYIGPGLKAKEVYDAKYTIQIPIKQPAFPVVRDVDPFSNPGRMVDYIVID